MMPTMSANNAKARFGELLDTARREPVTIEKHGRPVAVVMSTEDYAELEALKLSHLQAEVAIGLDEMQRGDFVEMDRAGLDRMTADVKQAGRNNAVK